MWLLLEFCRNLKPCKSAQERCRLPPALRKQTNSGSATLQFYICTLHIHNNQTHRLGLFMSHSEKRHKLFLMWWKAYNEAGVHWWKVLPVREDLENNCEKCSLKEKTLKIVVFLGSNHICVQIPSGIQSVALLVGALASQTSFHFEVFNFQIGLLLGCWFTRECFWINVSKLTFTFY